MRLIEATRETRNGPVIVFPPPRRRHVRPGWGFVCLLAVLWTATVVAAPVVWHAWAVERSAGL